MRGGRAGADFLLSLKDESLWIADEVASTPVLIPSKAGNLRSLLRAIEAMDKKGHACLADPILDPIHFGFTESLVRYRELRRRLPELQIMMGTGNLTELTDADTLGMQAILMGIVSELRITNILTTQVSAHASGVVQEADAARRMMYAAREADDLPRAFGEALLALRSLDPFPYSAEEIAATAAAIKDPSFRIQISPEGLHVYNRDGLRTATDPFKLFPASWARGRRFACLLYRSGAGAGADRLAVGKTLRAGSGTRMGCGAATPQRRFRSATRAAPRTAGKPRPHRDPGNHHYHARRIGPRSHRTDGNPREDEFVVLSPFRPSATLEHVLREKCAVVNYTDDVRIFAGCLTGRYDWPTVRL